MEGPALVRLSKKQLPHYLRDSGYSGGNFALPAHFLPTPPHTPTDRRMRVGGEYAGIQVRQ